MGLDRNSQAALDLYRKLKRAKDAGKLKGTIRTAVAPIRVRLSRDVDVTKANPNCKRCYGTGSSGTKMIPGNRGCEPVRVPIICRCVVAGGGIKPDPVLRKPGA